MNKTTKKIIAREFLYILGIIVLFIILIITFIFISDLKNDRADELEIKIEKITTNYNEMPYRLRVFYYINNELIESPYDKIEDREVFINDLFNDEKISSAYDYIKQNGNTDTSKEIFKEKVLKDKESNVYLGKIMKLEKELEKTKYSIFYRFNDEKLLFIGLILFGIFFILRYLIYGTKWSLKQIRQ